MPESFSDLALMERIRAGDKSACAQCIEHYAPGVYRLALRLTQNETDAEDVVQETFLQAFKAIDTFESRAGLSTWLYRITYNTVMMRQRQGHTALSIDETLQEDSGVPIPEQFFDWCCLPEQDFQTEESRAELERAISGLPETLRVVFIFR